MPETVSASDFHANANLPEWRFTLNRIETMFATGSFDRAADFVRQIANAAEAANHHPDIEVRYPGDVHIALTTHSVNALTTNDVDLARAISSLAHEAGITGDPLTSAAVEIAIDAMDIDAVLPFWRAVLDYTDELEVPEGGRVMAIFDPRHIGPPVWFQQMDAPRPQRNRIHLDVSVPYDVAEKRVAAALEAGGTLVTDKYARAYWVLADVEGNEACICTWQDRS